MSTSAVLLFQFLFYYLAENINAAFVDNNFNKYIELSDFAGLNCPADKTLFSYADGGIALCAAKCSNTPSCYGVFVLADNKCFGCKMQFSDKHLAPTLEGTKYYRRQNYVVVENNLDWNEAKINCESLGGHLADIKSLEEEMFIEKYAVQSHAENGLWIGGTDVQVEGTFLWLDGTKLSDWYTNWNPGEPNNNNRYSQSENCLKLNSLAGTWKWGDVNCTNENMSLCEYY